jgi:hypothetical protein
MIFQMIRIFLALLLWNDSAVRVLLLDSMVQQKLYRGRLSFFLIEKVKMTKLKMK